MPRVPKLPALKARARREGWAEWIRSERDERALLAGMRFDPARLERAEQFGSRFLRLCEGDQAGQPFVWMDWQRRDMFGPLFGWVRWSAHYRRWIRRFDRVYCEIPKKNGKSPSGAYVGLYMLVADQESGAKVFSAATTREQAKIVHSHAVNMAEASPRLMDLLRVNRTTATIFHEASTSSYRALSSIAGVNEGLNAHCIICDELHAWPNRTLWDALKWAFASRAEPILFAITTAGDDTESVCYEQHRYARAVLAGDVDDLSFLPLIYAVEDGDDEGKEATWRKANPSLGVIIPVDRFRQDYTEAKRFPSTLSAFRRYRFNRWLSDETVWLPPHRWDACGQDYSAEDLAGRTAYGGLDLATVSDMSSLALVFPDDDDDEEETAKDAKSPKDPSERRFWSLAWHWLPEATADRYRDRLPIDEWVQHGWLELTPGDVTDFGFIRRRIVELAERFELMEIAYDPWGAEQFMQEIEEEHGVRRAAFRQSLAQFAGPTAELERRVIAGTFAHPRDRLLTWQSRHCKVKTDANGNKRPVKPAPHSLEKIDGMVATIMAFDRAWKSGGDPWGDPDEYEVHSF